LFNPKATIVIASIIMIKTGHAIMPALSDHQSNSLSFKDRIIFIVRGSEEYNSKMNGI
jgi:hypothetical protein